MIIKMIYNWTKGFYKLLVSLLSYRDIFLPFKVAKRWYGIALPYSSKMKLENLIKIRINASMLENVFNQPKSV